MKHLFVLGTLLAGALSAQATYSDYFTVGTAQEEVENGGTVMFFTPSHINAGYYNDWYDYELEMLVKNVTDDDLKVACTLTWGSYPTSEEYIEHFEERIPGTEQFVYGFAKMCSGGYCYSPQFPANLGNAFITIPVEGTNALMCQLLNTPLDLVSEYKLVVRLQDDPEEKYECNIVFAPSEEAAKKFLGIEGETIDKSIEVIPAFNSILTELSEIELSSSKYNVAINPELAGSEIIVSTRSGTPVTVIAYDAITIADNKATLHLETPITEEDVYTMVLPKGYLKFGTDEEGFELPETLLVYRIKAEEENIELTVNPAPGPVESLSGFTIYVPWLTPTWKQDSHYKAICATLTLPDGEVVDLSPGRFEEVLEDPDDFWSSVIGRSYSFDTTYSTIGNYLLEIPAGMFYIDEAGENVNPDWKVLWSVGNTGITVIDADSSTVDVHTVDGITVISKGNRDRLQSLPTGTYIINGKKVRIIR